MTTDVQDRPILKANGQTVKFIFIGDPNDNGAGSHASKEDDDTDFRGSKRYGFTFPKGKAIEVPVNAKIGDTQMSVVEKLRNHSHYFEGSEEAFAAAKKSGAIQFRKAPPKRARLIKNIGVRGLDHGGTVQADDDDE